MAGATLVSRSTKKMYYLKDSIRAAKAQLFCFRQCGHVAFILVKIEKKRILPSKNVSKFCEKLQPLIGFLRFHFNACVFNNFKCDILYLK